MRKDFFALYAAAREKGLLITLFTNGTLISEDAARRLERERPAMIEITVHSLREKVFDAITRMKGSYEACMRGIRALHARGLPLVLKTVGLVDNADEILRIKEFAFSMDVVQFKFDPLVLPRHDLSREPCAYRMDPAKIAKLEQSDEEMREEWGRYLASGRCDGSECGAWTTSFYLDPHGRVRICPHMIRPSYDLAGGASREGLPSFLQETRKQLFTRLPECRDCEAAHLCGQCPARALLENGEPGRPAAYLCRLAHERTKIAGKELCRE
jgi:radical SAM protein with 4Fe4S-binding SPASM domain